MKTLPKWLSEMERLDKEATHAEEWETDLASDYQRMIAYPMGPKSFFRNGFDKEPIYQSQKDEEFIKKSRTELPRAVEVIKAQQRLIQLLEPWQECYEQEIEDIKAKIEKIINGD